MPRRPRIRCETLSRLEAQLRHAPRATLVRHLENAESLAGELDASREYPGEWIVFRVTGFRPESGDWPVHPGANVIAGLPAFCERLSERAAAASPEGEALDAAALRARWSVSVSTLRRLRALGLVARRVRASSGRTRLVFSKSAVEVFERAHPRALRSADRARPVRWTDAERGAIADEALAMADRVQRSAHRAAVVLSAKHARGVESVREFLLHDARTRGVFTAKARGGERRGEAMLRLWRLGADAASLAALAPSKTRAVRREIDLARRRRLTAWTLGLDAAEPPRVVAAPGAPAPVVLHPWPATLGALLAAWREQRALSGSAERALDAQLRTHLSAAARAALGADALHPSPATLDEGETALRAACGVVRALVSLHGRVILETIEARADRPLPACSPAEALRLLRVGVRASARGLLQTGATHGGRLAAPIALAADRALAAELRERPLAAHRGGRAADMIFFETPVPDPGRDLCPWHRGLALDPRAARAVSGGLVAQAQSAWLSRRFGLGARTPATLAMLTREHGLTPPRARAFEQRAIREAIRAGA
jgi:RNA polymerase primary sigma factor